MGDEVLKNKRGQASRFGADLKGLLEEAISLPLSDLFPDELQLRF